MGCGFPALDIIPLIFLTHRKLKGFNKKRNSQLDLAPTILDLQGINIPKGYWGKSLFVNTNRKVRFGNYRNKLFIESLKHSDEIDLHNPMDIHEKQIINLFNSVLINQNNIDASHEK